MCLFSCFNCLLFCIFFCFLLFSWIDLPVLGSRAVKRSGHPYLSPNTVPVIGPSLHQPSHISLKSSHQRSPLKKRYWLSLKKWWYVVYVSEKNIVFCRIKFPEDWPSCAFSFQEDMNLSEEKKTPLRDKDLNTKREMVIQYIGTASKTVSLKEIFIEILLPSVLCCPHCPVIYWLH